MASVKSQKYSESLSILDELEYLKRKLDDCNKSIAECRSELSECDKKIAVYDEDIDDTNKTIADYLKELADYKIKHPNHYENDTLYKDINDHVKSTREILSKKFKNSRKFPIFFFYSNKT